MLTGYLRRLAWLVCLAGVCLPTAALLLGMALVSGCQQTGVVHLVSAPRPAGRFSIWDSEPTFSDGFGFPDLYWFRFVYGDGRAVRGLPHFRWIRQAGDGTWIVTEKDGRGVLDSKGRYLVEPRYYDIYSLDGNVFVAEKDGVDGFVAPGDVWLPWPSGCEYYGPWQWHGGRMAVKCNGKWGFLNEKAEMVIPAVHSRVMDFQSPVTWVQKDGRWALVDKNGRFLSEFVYEDAHPFEGPATWVQKDGRWALIDKNGTLLTEFAYDAAKKFRGHISWASKDGRVAAIHKSGKLITDFIYEDGLPQFDGNSPIVAKKDGRWGAISPEGKVVIPFRYERMGCFRGGLAEAELDSRWGIIDQTGRWQMQLEPGLEFFKTISPGMFLIGDPQKDTHELCAIVNSKGETVLPLKLDWWTGGFAPRGLYEVHEGIMMVIGEDSYGFIRVSDGSWICQPQYDEALTFREGRAAVKKDGKWGFIDRDGKLVIPHQYDHVHTFRGDIRTWGFRNGRALVYKRYTPYLIDKSGKVVWEGEPLRKEGKRQPGPAHLVPLSLSSRAPFTFYLASDGVFVYGDGQPVPELPIFTAVSSFVDGTWVVMDENYLEGVLDSKGRYLVEPRYDKIFGLDGNVFLAEKDGVTGFVAPGGEWRPWPSGCEDHGLWRGGRMAVKCNGKWGFLNEKAEMVIPAVHSRVMDFRSPVTWVQKDGRWALIDENGRFLSEFVYEDAHPFRDRFSWVKKEGRWAAIDSSGKLITGFVYEDGLPQFDGNSPIAARKDGKWGAISPEGKVVIPFRFDRITGLRSGVIIARRDSRWGIIDATGRWQMRLEPGLEFFKTISPGMFLIGGKQKDKRELCGIVNSKGEMVVPLILPWDSENEGVFDVEEGIMMVPAKEGLGFIRASDGSWICRPQYEEAFKFSEGRAAVKKNGKWGFIDRDGKLVIPHEYDEVHTFFWQVDIPGFHHGRALVYKLADKKYTPYLIDKSGKVTWEGEPLECL